MPFAGKSLEELKKELKEKEIDWSGIVGGSKSLIEKFFFFFILYWKKKKFLNEWLKRCLRRGNNKVGVSELLKDQWLTENNNYPLEND